MQFFSKIVDWATAPYTVYLVLKDPIVSWSIKLRAVTGLVLIFAYVASPIDIIPDFIPLSGWLDDLIVVSLGFAIIRMLTPGIDIVEKRAHAQSRVRRFLFWTIVILVVAALLILTGICLLILTIVKLTR